MKIDLDFRPTSYGDFDGPVAATEEWQNRYFPDRLGRAASGGEE